MSRLLVAETGWNKLNDTHLMPRNRQAVRLRVYLTLLALDILAIIGAFAVGNCIIYPGQPFASPGVGAMVVLLPAYAALAANRGVYSIRIFEHWQETAQRAFTSFVIANLAILFAAYYLKANLAIPRVVFTIGFCLSAVTLPMIRWIVHRGAVRMAGAEPLSQVLMYEGAAPTRVAGWIQVNAETIGLRPNIYDPAAMDNLGRALKGVDRLVVSCEPDRRDLWATALKGMDVRAGILIPELGPLGMLEGERYGDLPTIVVSAGPLNAHNRVLKRGLDLAVALTALFLLAPLLCLTALAVKLDSPGPVFFVQPRMGRGNRLFSMFKFRSMRTDLCDVKGTQSTLREDPRITRVGRFIRATSIDELPQILNVIKGDMSIIGPRPHALGSLAGDRLFWEVDARYWMRHAAKPGITGLAQVRGFRGATHHPTDLTSRLQADLEYLNGWSIWRDIGILLSTCKVVLHRNAY
jgi:polysaccharide biosynthesis protein PslA